MREETPGNKKKNKIKKKKKRLKSKQKRKQTLSLECRVNIYFKRNIMIYCLRTRSSIEAFVT